MDPPEPPSPSDCCNSGCNPCILDVYEAQLRKYTESSKKAPEGASEVNSISPTSYTIFILTERKQISPTAFLLTFKYGDNRPKAPNCFKYRPGQYVMLRGSDFDGEFTRAYTPIPVSSLTFQGFVVLVRLYRDGRMSKLLQGLELGGTTSWRGPYGDFSIDYGYKYLFFVAQGTGIAPLFAIISEIVRNEECESFVKLFFCCRDCGDILLREELYELGAYWNFSYEVFLSNGNNLKQKYNETVFSHKLRESNLRDYLTGKSDLQALICGGADFNTSIKSQIETLGIESKHIYLF